MVGDNPNDFSNPNDFFGSFELWLVRGLVFLIFLIGLIKVGYDALRKIPK